MTGTQPRLQVELLTLAEAGALAKLSTRTLRRAFGALSNPLRYHRIGRAVRIAPDDLATWLRAHAATPIVSDRVIENVSTTARALIDAVNTDARTQRPAGTQSRRGSVTWSHRTSGE